MTLCLPTLGRSAALSSVVLTGVGAWEPQAAGEAWQRTDPSTNCFLHSAWLCMGQELPGRLGAVSYLPIVLLVVQLSFIQGPSVQDVVLPFWNGSNIFPCSGP